MAEQIKSPDQSSSMPPYQFHEADVADLSGLVALLESNSGRLDKKIMLRVTDLVLKGKTPEQIAALFLEFAKMAVSVVENCHDMANTEMVINGELHPDSNARLNMPTLSGALQGVKLARNVDHDVLCAGCAYRLGTIANQSPVTTCDAASSMPDQLNMRFNCHEALDDNGDTYKACAGYAQHIARQTRGRGDA
jgi:hypothetical protein